MKYPATITVIILYVALMLYNAYQAEQSMKAKDARIRELEYKVWSLELDKHIDSITDANVEKLRKKLGYPL